MKTFKEIYGQEKAIAFLRRIVATDALAHGYLFTGIQGIGKTTTAMAFALLINCTNPIDEDGCKRCSSCKKILDGNHPDLIIIEPDEDKKAIGINQIREIKRHLAFPPVLEGYRIVIMDPAEKMTDEAANAFLKTLEEPPPHNIFILNVRDPGELLPTIISRCQKVSFKPLPIGDIVHWLIEGEGIDSKKANIIAKLAEGSLGRAIKLYKDDLFTRRIRWINMLNSVVRNSSEMIIEMARKLSGFKASVSSKELKNDTIGLMLGIWKSWYRDILLFKLEGNQDLIVNSDLSNDIKTASALYTSDALMRSLAVIAKAERDLMENRNLIFLIERSLLGLRRAVKESYV